jgi:hypothetical protein
MWYIFSCEQPINISAAEANSWDIITNHTVPATTEPRLQQSWFTKTSQADQRRTKRTLIAFLRGTRLTAHGRERNTNTRPRSVGGLPAQTNMHWVRFEPSEVGFFHICKRPSAIHACYGARPGRTSIPRTHSEGPDVRNAPCVRVNIACGSKFLVLLLGRRARLYTYSSTERRWLYLCWSVHRERSCACMKRSREARRAMRDGEFNPCVGASSLLLPSFFLIIVYFLSYIWLFILLKNKTYFRVYYNFFIIE